MWKSLGTESREKTSPRKSLRSMAAPSFELEVIPDLLDGIRIVPKSHQNLSDMTL